MRKAAQAFRKLMMGLLMLAVLAAPLQAVGHPAAQPGPDAPAAAHGHGVAAMADCDAGHESHPAETVPDAGGDGADHGDLCCCVGAACPLLHAGLAAPDGLLIAGPPPARALPALSAQPEGVAPDPIQRPPRRSV